MRKIGSTDDPAVAAYLRACDEAAQRQIDESRGVFDRLSLPLPRSDDEWQALRRWLDDLQRKIGKHIAIEFRAQPAS